MHDNIPLLTQSQKQNFANTVYSKTLLCNTEKGLTKFHRLLKAIKFTYGTEILKKILNSPCSSLYNSQDYALSLVVSMNFTDAEKILLSYGAQIIDAKQLSVISASLFLKQIQQTKGDTFDPTLVSVNICGFKGQFNYIEQYFRLIKEQMLRGVLACKSKTFIIADTHWHCCHVRFCMNNHGEPMIYFYFIDSVYKYNLNLLYNDQFINIASRVFGEKNVQAYKSEETLQRDGKSCRLFSVIFARMLHSLEYGKFKRLYPEYDLFADLKQIINDFSPWNDWLNDGGNVPLAPAKLRQLSQYAYDEVGNLEISSNTVVNSIGGSLSDSLLVHKKLVICDGEKKWFNTKATTKLQKMSARLNQECNFDEGNIEHINKVVTQFSVTNLKF